MSARILVVDDLAPNRHLLEVKLSAEYYDVVMASDGRTALDIAGKGNIDLILLDAMMPGLNGFETCEALKTNPDTWHIPVIMVTALEETKDRIQGLEAGADDFVTKPIDDFNLMARVRSLLRLKMVTDQLLTHTGNSLRQSRQMLRTLDQRRGKILILDDHVKKLDKTALPLEPMHDVLKITDPKEAFHKIRSGVDLAIVSLVSDHFDGLRFCARLRADADTRELPILAIGDVEDQARLLRAYDIGINDTLMRPLETQELLARVNTQMKRKFYADSLRDNFNENLEMVVTDPLTGLGNRRYFDAAVEPLFQQIEQGGPGFSIAIFDVDHFKRVNDILGHDVGDLVLKDIAARLASNIRAVDILSRYGGEEFMLAMPETNSDDALAAVERIRSLLGGSPIYVDGEPLLVTASAGIAEARPGEKLRDVFKRADDALFAAKHAGRNRALASETQKAA